MAPPLLGLHHVTATVDEAQADLDFCVGLLGLRLVKRTVNFDDATAYHLYFGDAAGTPGSLLTLFPMPHARPGRPGTGQAAVTTLAIPPASLGWWLERLAAHRVAHELPARRFREAAPGDGGETVIAFQDPDGLRLELATDPRADALPGRAAPDAGTGTDVPAEHAIRGVFGVTLWVEAPADLERLLAERFGMRRAAHEGTLTRWIADDATLGRVVDVRDASGFWPGVVGVGGVHHVAFRVRDLDEALAVKAAVMRDGISTTPVRERHYFESVYFRPPGGVLFELATDGPGFAIDEPPGALGATLRLPPTLEPSRDAIEAALPPLRPVRPLGAPDASAMSAFAGLTTEDPA